MFQFDENEVVEVRINDCWKIATIKSVRPLLSVFRGINGGTIDVNFTNVRKAKVPQLPG